MTNLYEKTRETADLTAELRYANSFRSCWNQWPSIKSFACLSLKFQLGLLFAGLLLVVPAGILALVVAAIYQNLNTVR